MTAGPFARVLVPVDFSDGSRAAARVAARLLAPGGTLRLLHVLPPPFELATPGAAMPALKDEGAFDEAQRRLQALAREIGASGAETRGTRGSVAREVAREAESFGADLVVVGAHGRSGAAIGSKARAVARHAGASVLVVRGVAPDAAAAAATGAAAGAPFRRIAVATDFYPPAATAARRALALADATGADLVALHAFDPGLFGSALAVDERDARDGADRSAIEKALRALLHRFNVEALGGRARESMAMGRPVDGIARLATEAGADLVVVGTHGPGAFERALIGSVAEGLVERAPCSVLVARP